MYLCTENLRSVSSENKIEEKVVRLNDGWNLKKFFSMQLNNKSILKDGQLIKKTSLS